MTPSLPQLTPEEASLLGSLLISDAPLYDVALDCGISVIAAIEILARPHCREYLKAARDAARRRFEAKAAEHAAAALQTLREIGETREIPPDDQLPTWDDDRSTTRDRVIWQIERRRAATTIIRAATPHKRKRRSRSDRDPSATSPAGEVPASPRAGGGGATPTEPSGHHPSLPPPPEPFELTPPGADVERAESRVRDATERTERTSVTENAAAPSPLSAWEDGPRTPSAGSVRPREPTES